MSSKKLTDTLNKLLNIDLQSHQIYLQAAAWAIDHQLEGCKKFLLHHAAEELGHMHRSFTYLDDRNLKITFTALPAPVIRANDVAGLFREVLDHEMKVTAIVNDAVNIAREEGDHDAFEFLQWFVVEQREEEKVCRTVLDRIALIGNGPSSLYFIDREVASTVSEAA